MLEPIDQRDAWTVAPKEVSAPSRPKEQTEEPRADAPLLAEDLLVEDVSIDGMCGVY
jgi:mycofactocin precursor